MELGIWKEWYERIAKALDLNVEKDREGARVLSSILGESWAAPEEVASIIKGRDVVVFGPAAVSDEDYTDTVIISAGSPSRSLTVRGIQPDILVTDLDGDIPAQLEANGKGAFAVIHAHGDNIEALKRWVPGFTMPRMGTTQVEPLSNVYNFGGFTDGDRAVVMAAHFGARNILLEGFDFDTPIRKVGGDPERKVIKLAYAKQIIEHVSTTHSVEIVRPEPR